MDVFSKLKQARKLLGLSQEEAAAGAKMVQKDISLLESSKKEFIPTSYILFLYKKGVDMNTLFSPDSAVSLRHTDSFSNNLSPSRPGESGPNRPKNGGQFVRIEEFSRLEKTVKDLLKKLDK